MTPLSASQDDALAWLRLTLVPGVGERALRDLLKAFATPQQVLAASPRELERVVALPVARALASGAEPAKVEAALAWLGKPGCQLVSLADEAYPKRLLQISDPPAVLYVRGRLDLLNTPSIAIVGSRSASPVGARDAEAFAEALSGCGYTVVSGLAVGIDAAAHRGGLAGGAGTLAVMGTGADRIYPPENRELAQRIHEHGTIVSEFPLGTPPDARNFPKRNRLLSAVSLGVLVVEAALKSGSLLTAKSAAEQGRDVFAIPGSIHSPVSKGCHWLIKQGAKVVESAEDVLVELGYEGDLVAKSRPAVRKRDPLLEAMGFAATSIDQLAGRTGQPAPEISTRLAQLEFEGRIARLAGGLFQRLAPR